MAESDEAPAGKAGAPANVSGKKSNTKSIERRWGYEDPEVEAARAVLEEYVSAAKRGAGIAPSADVIRAGVTFADADPLNWPLLLGRLERAAKHQAFHVELGHAVERRRALQLVSLGGRQPRSVRWAWNDRIPLKAPTLVVGEPGQGKSTLLAEMAAGYTRGTNEGDLYGEPCSVVLCSAEDAIDEVLVPRLIAAGADISRVCTPELAGVLSESGLILPRDLDALAYRIEEVGAKVLIIDPIVAYMPGTMDSHKDQHVRRVLRPLAQMAEDLGIAVVAVMHLNKNQAATVLNRVGASIGFVAAARSVLLLGSDPEGGGDDGGRVLAHAKSNYSALAPSLALRIVDRKETVHDESGSPLSVAGLEWLGECDVSATDLIAIPLTSEDSRTVREEAGEWIKAQLTGGPKPAVEMLADGVKQLGCSKRTLKAAKKEVGATSHKEGDHWVWTLPVTATPAVDVGR